MFETIYNALDNTPTRAEVMVAELQDERELLLESRAALSTLLRAVGTENFSRTGRAEMSQSLRAAIRQAEQVLR